LCFIALKKTQFYTASLQPTARITSALMHFIIQCTHAITQSGRKFSTAPNPFKTRRERLAIKSCSLSGNIAASDSLQPTTCICFHGNEFQVSELSGTVTRSQQAPSQSNQDEGNISMKKGKSQNYL